MNLFLTYVIRTVIIKCHISVCLSICLSACASFIHSFIRQHSFWMGSAQAPPMYQYRIILPLEDNKYTVNVASDPDFNIEAEFKANVNQNIVAKANIVVCTYVFPDAWYCLYLLYIPHLCVCLYV